MNKNRIIIYRNITKVPSLYKNLTKQIPSVKPVSLNLAFKTLHTVTDKEVTVTQFSI